MHTPPRILVVDDNAANVEILRMRLEAQGYEIVTATDGEAALTAVSEHRPDLILLDVMMPKLDGIEVCRRLRADATLPFIPIVMVTAKSDSKDVVAALEAGGDEYLTKPVDHAALGARVKSMLRVKALQDEVQRQADALKEWNLNLEARVNEQVAQLARMSQLKRFFSPNVADAIIAVGEKSILTPHRREICYVFLDLRGFTAFTDAAEPEEVEMVLRDYHAAMGNLVTQYEGTIDRFAGDGILIFFNDPLPIPDGAKRAAKMALEMQSCFAPLRARWLKLGYNLDLGIGIAQGFATLGAFGFEGRWDYSAIGGVVNLAARLCATAQAGQILVDRRTRAALDDDWELESVGPLTLNGFTQPIAAFLLKGAPV
ncbi:MAG TPA: response regulator [Casimicrobiaceae bacterium]